MRFAWVWTILRKELRDALRDRRTLLMMVGLPVLLYPLMMIGSARIAQSQAESTEERVSQVAVWGELPPILDAALQQEEKVALLPWQQAPTTLRAELDAGTVAPIMPPDDEPEAESSAAEEQEPKPEEADPVIVAARQAILARSVDAVIVAWPGLEEALTDDALGHISIYYDSVRADSDTAAERVRDRLDIAREHLVVEREQRHGLTAGFSRALAVQRTNVAQPKRRAGNVLGGVLGLILIYVSVIASFYTAIDVTAGEKERGTMETLLCAPVHPREIIAGKFLAVWAISIIAGIANVVSLGLSVSRITADVPDLPINLSTLGLALAFLLPVSFTLTAAFMTVAVFARDFKDGQNFLTPVLLFVLLPPGLAMLPGVELTVASSFIPITNISLLIRAVFLGEAKPDLIFLTLLASWIYGMLAILAAARVFERETILLGGRVSLRELFAGPRKRDNRPTPSAALALFAVVLVVAFYGSLALQSLSIPAMLGILQLGFFLLPALLAVRLLRYPTVSTLSLRPPAMRGALAAVVLGLSTWTFAAGIGGRLIQVPESLVRALEKVLLLDDGSAAPLWLLLLVVAVLPAVCEELLFRGVILSGLRPLGRWPAIVVSATLFAVAHASLYRLLPTLVLGLVLGYVVWQTGSIFTGILIHALNNGLMVTVARSETLQQALGAEGSTALPWVPTVIGSLVMLVALALLWRPTASR